jgi:hypothetical protein
MVEQGVNLAAIRMFSDLTLLLPAVPDSHLVPSIPVT